MSDGPTLSVVLAHPRGSDMLAPALAALRTACGGIEHEILVVHGPGDAPSCALPHARALRLADPDHEPLVPELWGHGLREARGRIVAFTTSHMRVSPHWARALLAAIDDGATGAGGAIDVAPGTGARNMATWLLRYSAFRPPFGPGPVREIAGDNAAYRRDALQRHSALFGGGFWEMEFHARLREDGSRLMAVPEATASMIACESLVRFLRQRYAHGRRFGEWRVRAGGQSVARVLAAAPLVPGVMAGRALVRVAGSPRLLARSVAALPHLLLLAVAWAGGEARGAWRARHAFAPLAEEYPA